MKSLLVSLLFLLAGSTEIVAAPENKTSESETRRAERLLEEFYGAYCRDIACPGGTKSDKLFERYLTEKLVNKIKIVGEESGYDLVIRAQDFNRNAIETITATHVAGNWYAIAYLDSYTHKCVIIPVKVMPVDGILRLDDIAAE